VARYILIFCDGRTPPGVEPWLGRQRSGASIPDAQHRRAQIDRERWPRRRRCPNMPDGPTHGGGRRQPERCGLDGWRASCRSGRMTRSPGRLLMFSREPPAFPVGVSGHSGHSRPPVAVLISAWVSRVHGSGFLAPGALDAPPPAVLAAGAVVGVATPSRRTRQTNEQARTTAATVSLRGLHEDSSSDQRRRWGRLQRDFPGSLRCGASPSRRREGRRLDTGRYGTRCTIWQRPPQATTLDTWSGPMRFRGTVLFEPADRSSR